MSSVKNLFIKYPIRFLTLLFICVRLPFLTRLPIFNDESIYLDWGWKELHDTGRLFYSLYDGKQPLLMWIFGFSQMIIPNFLIAGRLVAVIFGLLTFLGLYQLGKRYFSKRVAFLACLLYLIVPIFTTFDRLALMESAISACAIWTVYFTLWLQETEKKKYAVYLGVALGIGFFIKSTMAVFIVLVIGSFIYQIIRHKKKQRLFQNALITAGVFITCDLLLFIQPLYWQTIGMNSRYSLTLSELLHFPISTIASNGIGNLAIMAVFLTPLVLLSGVVGMIQILRDNESQEQKLLVFWFIGSLLIQTIVVRVTSQRYLVSFLPLIVLFAAFAIYELMKKSTKLFYSAVFIVVIIPLIMTGIQMVSPVTYTNVTLPITKYTQKELVFGQTSGYGLDTVAQYISEQIGNQPAYVATAINAGNPENTMPLYFHNDSNVVTGYLDKRMFGQVLSNYQCIKATVPVFFVSRDQQQANMEDYFEQIYRVRNPYSDYSLGVYRFKTDCQGKTLVINPMNQ